MGTLRMAATETKTAKQAVPEAKDEGKDKANVAAGTHEKSA